MKFNKQKFQKKFKELITNTPTSFESPNGPIYFRKELVKNILVTIKHLTQDLDVFMVFVGREGSGKSLFVRQVNFVYWYLLFHEFKLIDYPYDLDLIHFGTKELQEDRRNHDAKGLKYRISNLDESKDDLGRDKHMNPDAKNFIDYMRRCRDERGIMSLLLPQLSELMPRITLSRAVLIFEVDYNMDEQGDIVRGEYKTFIIPRGRTGRSLFHNKDLSTSKIKTQLSEYLYTNKRQFESIPKSCLFFQGNFNHVDPIDTKAYEKKKREKKWERIRRDENTKSIIKRYESKVQDYRTLILALKAREFTNKGIGEMIGKSEGSIRMILKQFEKSQS